MTLEEINQAYLSVASQIGDAQYKIRQYNQLLEELYQRADALNQKAHEIQNPKEELESKEE